MQPELHAKQEDHVCFMGESGCSARHCLPFLSTLSSGYSFIYLSVVYSGTVKLRVRW